MSGQGEGNQRDRELNVVQVQCVARGEGAELPQRISRIGGVGRDGRRWWMTQARAIEAIAQGEWSFWIATASDSPRWLTVATTRSGEQYLTAAEGDAADDPLLLLPECPWQ